MPKVIDNYILQEKIGAGQFGDVFKGHHQETNQEVAIKSIRRQTIKGKFYELLENEIKVLKTCDNPNIIKLYAIKKTANHFYLMLEYCNQGDMLAYVRKLGTVPQQKAIKFFCQILNAFQDLVKHKIMHRDFKLANILLHDGNIKIADFGFAKLLAGEDYATTMLGSPLNMAPEVLGNNKYNSKADIWSIGACLWEMLYGKPPYIANNMVDLLNLIKTKPLKFPPSPKINQTLKDVLKKMLVADSKRRISWSDLFNHPITTYLARQLREQINLQLVQDESLVMNTSKFYMKKNLVIDNPDQIHEKQKMNEYLIGVIKDGKKKEQFKMNQQEPQKYHKVQSTTTKTQTSSKQQTKLHDQKQTANRNAKQKQKQNELKVSQKQQKPSQKTRSPRSPRAQQSSEPALDQEAIQKSLLQLSFRNNMKNIMHYRNIYVFMANVSDEILSPVCLEEFDIFYKDSQVIAYLVVQKILATIKWLISAIKSKNCLLENVEKWELFYQSKQLAEITDYICKQLQVFTVFKQSIQPNIKKGIQNGQYSQQLKQILQSNPISSQSTDKMLKKYIKEVLKQITNKMLQTKKTDPFKSALKHIEYCLIACDTSKKFGKKDFNFNEFYDSYNRINVEEILMRIERCFKQL